MGRTRRRRGGLVGLLRGEPHEDSRARPTAGAGDAPPDAGADGRAGDASDVPMPADAQQHEAAPRAADAATPAAAVEASAEPEAPAAPATGWAATLKRTGKGFKEDGLQDWAAALTYYSVLSLFPLLLVLVALVGLFGEYPRTVDAMLDIVRDVAPGTAAATVEESITGVVQDKGGAGALLGVGLLTALWTASGYIGAFMRATNAVYDVDEGRPFWKLRPLQLAVTAVMVVLLALLAVGFVVSGSIARALGDTIGLGDSAVTVWDIAKWPAMLVIAVMMVALLTYVGPNVRQRFRLITPGAALSLGALVLASAGFAFYVGNFGSYNATYGALGGVIVFLVWLWIANLALLFGVELDVERARSRQLRAGNADAADGSPVEPRTPADG